MIMDQCVEIMNMGAREKVFKEDIFFSLQIQTESLVLRLSLDESRYSDD